MSGTIFRLFHDAGIDLEILLLRARLFFTYQTLHKMFNLKVGFGI